MEALAYVYEQLLDGWVLKLGMIMALVQFIKDLFGLEGKVNMAVSFGVGVVLAGVYYIGYLFPESAQFVEGAFFILTAGLVASGFYSILQKTAERAGG